jgi:SAM-dependent methyltransferase
MSAFADKTFSSETYSSARPSYPQKLFDYLFEYHDRHSAFHELAVDIACGTGEATNPLASYFDKVIGTDNSQVMVEKASEKYPALTFEVSKAETFFHELGLDLHSVDLITVAEGIHWFDLPKFFAEAHRALKPNGTLAYWGYCDPIIAGHPDATTTLIELCYGDKYLGPYWQQPGRSILRNRIPTQPPAELFTALERHDRNESGHIPPAGGKNSDQFVLHKEVSVSMLLEYIYSWSSYHSWRKENPDDPDIAQEVFTKLKETNGWTDSTLLTLHWDTFLVLMTAK